MIKSSFSIIIKILYVFIILEIALVSSSFIKEEVVDYFEKTTSSEKTILVLGQSTSAFYPNSLEKMIQKENYSVNIINKANPNVKNGLGNANSYIEEYKPDIILMMIHGNINFPKE
ncbi:hypothetical protein KY334_07285, partial [Candidatus Woesearchaeota archaeon]|nr:hypothetical protein [Candidatus Woesearchaeota archaeon]